MAEILSLEYIHGWWIPVPLPKDLEVPKQIVTKASVKGKLKIRNYFQGWGMGAITSILGGVKL